MHKESYPYVSAACRAQEKDSAPASGLHGVPQGPTPPQAHGAALFKDALGRCPALLPKVQALSPWNTLTVLVCAGVSETHRLSRGR